MIQCHTHFLIVKRCERSMDLAIDYKLNVIIMLTDTAVFSLLSFFMQTRILS